MKRTAAGLISALASPAVEIPISEIGLLDLDDEIPSDGTSRSHQQLDYETGTGTAGFTVIYTKQVNQFISSVCIVVRWTFTFEGNNVTVRESSKGESFDSVMGIMDSTLLEKMAAYTYTSILERIGLISCGNCPDSELGFHTIS